MRYRVVVEGRTFDIEVSPGGRVWVNRQPLDVDLESINGLPEYSLLVDHRSYETQVEAQEEGECRVVVAGRPYQTSLGMARDTVQACSPAEEGPLEICVPLPGLLSEVRVTEGQWVEEGGVVAVLESMKMNIELCAPRSGAVQALRVAAGQEVAQGEVVAVIE